MLGTVEITVPGLMDTQNCRLKGPFNSASAVPFAILRNVAAWFPARKAVACGRSISSGCDMNVGGEAPVIARSRA